MTDFDEIWQSDASWPPGLRANKILRIQKSKTASDAILENKKISISQQQTD